jgi:endonuclease III
MPRRTLTLGDAIKSLRTYYGPPAPVPTADPFELILWENVAYLASPARREQAFAELKAKVGTKPTALLRARPEVLERITARGILKDTFAAKLRECAQIAVEEFDSDLDTVIQGPPDKASKALRKFPGIGEPGAEKILLFTGRQAFLAPDSNGLRVLVRLGLIREEKSYARTYAQSRPIAQAFSSEPQMIQEAHLLLQQHGQTLCKRSAPRCEECPLAIRCAYYLRERHGR